MSSVKRKINSPSAPRSLGEDKVAVFFDVQNSENAFLAQESEKKEMLNKYFTSRHHLKYGAECETQFLAILITSVVTAPCFGSSTKQ